MNRFSKIIGHYLVKNGITKYGFVDYEPCREIYLDSYSRYSEWINHEYQGKMGYLERGAEFRRNPELLFPNLKGVAAVLMPYHPQALGFEDPAEGPKYARYLRGDDYHKRIKNILKTTLDQALIDQKFNYKICVDTSAVMERTWGVLTGLGWIGKNGMLIHPKIGSYHFIAVVYFDHEFGETAKVSNDLCGSCNSCVVGCPTNAILDGKTIDSRRCLSYLTLEHRGGFSDEEINLMQKSNWIAGCDICQEVCPFNRKVERYSAEVPCSEDTNFRKDWEFLDSEKFEIFTERLGKSAINRIKEKDWRRNVEILSSQNSRNHLELRK